MYSHRGKLWLHLSPNRTPLGDPFSKYLLGAYYMPGTELLYLDTVWVMEFSNTIPENNSDSRVHAHEL